MRLVQNLLRDPQERRNFFQVFVHLFCTKLNNSSWTYQMSFWVLRLLIIHYSTLWDLWSSLFSRMSSQKTLDPRMTKRSRPWCGCFCQDLRSFFPPKLSNRCAFYDLLNFVLHKNITLEQFLQGWFLPFKIHQFSSCLCQIAALLSNASSVLSECMQTFTQPQELKSLLDTQKDLSQLEDIGELRITTTWSQNIIAIKNQNDDDLFICLKPFSIHSAQVFHFQLQRLYMMSLKPE